MGRQSKHTARELEKVLSGRASLRCARVRAPVLDWWLRSVVLLVDQQGPPAEKLLEQVPSTHEVCTQHAGCVMCNVRMLFCPMQG